ncbi:hypothetical protein CYR52_14705 [Chimaeribacter arupi]|nr:hypothetical protein CYR52_14705 [Chimaeribacter arupi]
MRRTRSIMKEYTGSDVSLPPICIKTDRARLRKPSSVKEIFNALEPKSFSFALEKGMTLDFRQGINYIFLLKKGTMSMVRGDNDLYVKVNIERTILGLANAIYENTGHYFIAETRCELSYIPIAAARDIFTERKLWQAVCEAVTYSMVALWKESYKIVGKTAYEQIKEIINDVCSQPDDVRENIKIAAYIQKRTSISRTNVMRILRALKYGEYIGIGQNGKGIVVYKELPKKF